MASGAMGGAGYGMEQPLAGKSFNPSTCSGNASRQTQDEGFAAWNLRMAATQDLRKTNSRIAIKLLHVRLVLLKSFWCNESSLMMLSRTCRRARCL